MSGSKIFQQEIRLYCGKNKTKQKTHQWCGDGELETSTAKRSNLTVWPWELFGKQLHSERPSGSLYLEMCVRSLRNWFIYIYLEKDSELLIHSTYVAYQCKDGLPRGDAIESSSFHRCNTLTLRCSLGQECMINHSIQKIPKAASQCHFQTLSFWMKTKKLWIFLKPKRE